MYTQCPECLTIFEIDEDALQASLGIVRCGHCQQRFDALRTLSDSLPGDPAEALPEQDPEARTPTLTEAVSPDAIKAAGTARRRRKRDAPAPTQDAPTPADPADVQWLTPADARTRALIADAAGIPPETIQADPAWQVIDVPVQISFAELDLAPPASTGPATDAADRDTAASPTESTLPPDDDAVAPESANAGTRAPPTATHVDDPPAAAAAASPSADTTRATATPDTDAPSPLPFDVETLDAAAATTDTVPDTPVYVPPRRRRIRRSDWLWALGCLVLALALAAQVAWARRAALMLDPATQPWVLQACANVDCRLPPIRDSAKLELLSRDIRPDPKAAGALMITATFRNDAVFHQPWPVVVVELTDLDNDTVAMRRFRPPEYLPDPARRAAGIAPGATAAVAFEVADPGKRAVAFRFGFD